MGGAVSAVLAVIVAAGFWQYKDLRSAATLAKLEVQSEKSSAESSIRATATATQQDLGKEAADVRTATKTASNTFSQEQRAATRQGTALHQQANAASRDFREQAGKVRNEVVAAEHDIESATQLEPEMVKVRKELASAQEQIAQQQKVITSAADFAKQIFSARKLLRFDLKDLDKDDYAIAEHGRNGNTPVVYLYLILPSVPVAGTISPQFHQIVPDPASFFSLANLLVLAIQKDSIQEITGQPFTVGYFPDPSQAAYVSKLSVKDGTVYINGNYALPWSKVEEKKPIANPSPSLP